MPVQQMVHTHHCALEQELHFKMAFEVDDKESHIFAVGLADDCKHQDKAWYIDSNLASITKCQHTQKQVLAKSAPAGHRVRFPCRLQLCILLAAKGSPSKTTISESLPLLRTFVSPIRILTTPTHEFVKRCVYCGHYANL